MFTSTPLEGGARPSTWRPKAQARSPARISAAQPITMPPPTSPVISRPTMFRNATGGVKPYSSTLSIVRAATDARPPKRRSAATPAASDATMQATTQSTPSTLGGCARNHLPGRLLGLAPLLHEPLGQRRRLADVVALRVVHAEPGQQLERLLVADHLRHRALAEPARDVDDGLDHELVRPVVQAGAHELAVDLEVVERQVLEVEEARERRAEVVEREPAAQRVEVRGELLGARDVADRRRSRDLEDDLLGVDPVGAELVLDQLEQLGVAGRAAGDVDLEHEPVLARELLAEHLDRAAHDPLVDRADQVVALGDGQEGRGRDELPERVAQPQQELVLVDLAAREVHDRLGLKDEALLVERVADHVRPRQAGGE